MLAVDRGAEDPFVGRGVELRRLREWRAAGGRLLTLRGPAGVGKSRLAWEFARACGAGAIHVDVAGSDERDAVELRVAGALGVTAETAPPRAAVERALRARGPLLVVLDDLDPLTPTDAIAGWLAAAPDVSFVVTSRASTQLSGEQILEVEPLAIADEAVELLRLRAASAGADLQSASPAVLRRIAAALDGLPLAIELAAGQLAHLPAEQLLERLPARLELLVRTPGTVSFARHTTLRAAIEESWRQLDAGERMGLAQASVFRGGFDAEAADAVLAVDAGPAEAVIRSLRDRSLLQVRALAPGRYVLDESVRTFAARHLGPAERAAVERRHAKWFLSRAEPLAAAVEARSDVAAAAALEREAENLLEIHRRALARTHVPSGEASDALRAAILLAPLLMLRQRDRFALELLDAALEAASPSRTDPHLRCRALLARGTARLLSGRPASALADLLEAAGLARGAGDSLLEGRVLLRLSRVHREQGRDEDSRRSCERAIDLLRGLGADEWLGKALGMRGLIAAERDEGEDTIFWFGQAIDVHVRCGDRRASAVARGNLGITLFDMGREVEALDAIRAAMDEFHELGDSGNEASLRGHLALAHGEAGEWDRACAELDRGLALARHASRRRLEGTLLGYRAGVLFEAGRTDDALAAYEASAAVFRELGDQRNLALSLLALGVLLAERGQVAEAERQIDRAEHTLREIAHPTRGAAVAAARGTLAVVRARTLRAAGIDAVASSVEAEAARLLDEARNGGASRREEGRLLVRRLERALAGSVAP